MEGGAQVPTEKGKRPKLSKAERRERMRLLAAFVVAALMTAFALLNLDKVRVHWIVATGRTPLIIVIVVSFLLGIAADRAMVLRGRRGKK